MARKNKPAEEPGSLRATILYNKVMLDAVFDVLEQKRILTREEVENRATDILHKTCPVVRWLQ